MSVRSVGKAMQLSQDWLFTWKPTVGNRMCALFVMQSLLKGEQWKGIWNQYTGVSSARSVKACFIVGLSLTSMYSAMFDTAL